MSEKTFSLVAGTIFFVVAVLHILRLAMGWQAVLAGWTIPVSDYRTSLTMSVLSNAF